MPVNLCPYGSHHCYISNVSHVILSPWILPFVFSVLRAALAPKEPPQSTPVGEWWWFRERCCLPPPTNLSNFSDAWSQTGDRTMSNSTNTTACCAIGLTNASNLTLEARIFLGFNASSNSSIFQNCSWGVGAVCPRPPPDLPIEPIEPIPDADGGVYVAGVAAAGGGGLGDVWLNCTSRPGRAGGGEQWSEVLSLRQEGGAAPARSGGFVLRLNSTGRNWWLRGPVPALSGASRQLSKVRLAPWVATGADTLAAHGMAHGHGPGAAPAAGVYLVALLQAAAPGTCQILLNVSTAPSLFPFPHVHEILPPARRQNLQKRRALCASRVML